MKKYIFAHPWLLVLSALTGGILQGILTLSPIVTGWIIDAIVGGNQDDLFSFIWLAAAMVFAVWAMTGISIRMFSLYGAKSQRTLERKFFESTLGTRISEFGQTNSAKYISVLNNDINTIAGSYFYPMANFSKDALAVLFAVIALLILNPINAAIAVATAFLPLLGPVIYGKRLAKAHMQKSMQNITFNQKVKDYLTGFEVIKTYGVEKNVIPRFFRAATGRMRAHYKAGAVAGDVGAVTIGLVKAVSFINYFAAGFFVLRGVITIGEMTAIIGLSMAIFAPMTLVSNHIASIRATKEISKRVLDMMEQEDTTPRLAELKSLNNEIIFRNVNFAYNGAEEGNFALKNVNYSFKKGGKYAVVGGSGSGKSTLAKLIMGYYDEYEGDVLLDNHNVRDISRRDLYGVVSALHQNVFLLDDSLRNNVTLYNNYSDAAYNNALERANLTAVEAALPKGSDTNLGEGGNTISGGERQRISIARALLKGTEVLVLDEATASLDNVVAHDIENSIMAMDDLTCIFVTHRYSADILGQCDGILVLKDGEICEQGTFAELVARNGHFSSLLQHFPLS